MFKEIVARPKSMGVIGSGIPANGAAKAGKLSNPSHFGT
jgi:hypothetical protein